MYVVNDRPALWYQHSFCIFRPYASFYAYSRRHPSLTFRKWYPLIRVYVSEWMLCQKIGPPVFKHCATQMVLLIINTKTHFLLSNSQNIHQFEACARYFHHTIQIPSTFISSQLISNTKRVVWAKNEAESEIVYMNIEKLIQPYIYIEYNTREDGKHHQPSA